MRRPFPKRTITSPFGRRVIPGATHAHHHAGIDYGVPAGSPVRAIADGVITQKQKHEQLGNSLTIKHNDDQRSKYHHLQDFAVMKGDKVTKGQIIGWVGDTGRSARGPHLCQEAWEKGVNVDPETWYTE